MKRIMILITFAWSMGLSYSCMGQDESEAVRQVHHDIILLNLINGLYLTSDQTDALLQKVQEATKVRQHFRSQLDGLEEMTLSTMVEIRSVLIQGREIPDEMKGAFHQLKKRKYALEDQKGEALKRLEADVSDVLTPNQKVVIDHYKPCVIPPADGKIGQDEESRGAGLLRTLDRLRSIPNHRYHQVKEMVADMTLEKADRYIGFETDEEKEAYRKQLHKTFQQAREMSDKEFLMRKQEIADSIMPEATETHKRRKNQLGRIGHFLLDSALLHLLTKRQEFDG